MSRDWKPAVAGALDLVAGAGSLLGAAVLGGVGVALAVLPAEVFEGGPPPAWAPLLVLALALWLLAVGAVAVVGGIAVVQRRGGRWPLAGAVAAIVASGLLGVPALILTVLAESDERRRLPAAPDPAGA